MDLSKYGPWAVIAGGSEGVGSAFARLLAQSGVNLVLIARKPGPLAETAATCRACGVEVRTIEADLTDGDALVDIVESTADLEVGLLIYNAGANSYGHEFVTGDLDRFADVIDLNISSQLTLVRHLAAPMRERRRGGVLLVGSMQGFTGAERISVYAAAKAFGRVFAEGLWLELREYDVDVLELVLGVTRTPAMARAGLNLDLPGLNVAEPAEVAREGLEALLRAREVGPTYVAGGNAKAADRQPAPHSPDRAAYLLAAQKASRALLPETR